MTKEAQLIKNSSKTARPPVVVILGHVDHGKTSLLDYIRKTKVVEKETGGITQHIGAYQIEIKKISLGKGEEASRKITFIDTPGHEAFYAMRSRGAKVADIAVLVVAADEGVKPQTREAIEHIKKLNLPTVVAINKVDKPTAQPEKVKKELLEQDIVVESYGGKVPSVEVSAKTGQGIDDLLEIILLIAEIEGLESDPFEPASGVIIESYQDSFRGPTATLLIKEGTLKVKDVIMTESTYGTVKKMEDWRGEELEKAEPSQPVVIIGLEGVPMVGEKWEVVDSIEEARKKSSEKSLLEQKKRIQAEVLDIAEGVKVLNIILKADVVGSLEAIRESLQSIRSDKVVLRLLKTDVGDINESDIKLAESGHALIIGFRVKCSSALNQLTEQKNIKILLFDIIYELIQKIREAMADLLPLETIRTDVAKLKVIALFKKDKSGQIFGAKVLSGKVEKGLWLEVWRKEEKIGKGKILGLQYEKKEVNSVPVGKNAGIFYRGDVDVELDDILVTYREEKKKKEL